MAYRLIKISLFGVLAVILAVSLGCGGDDGSGMAAMMPDDTEAMMTAGLAGGLTRSPESSVYADNSQDTLAALLQGGETVFSTLSSTLLLDYGMDTAVLPDQSAAYVKSFSGDGMGGFNLVSVFDGEETSVHFDAGDYDPSLSSLTQTPDDGETFYALFSYTYSYTDGSSEFDYLDLAYWFHYQGSDAAAVAATGNSSLFQGKTRDSFMVYGARTPSGDLPIGSATYEGRMEAGFWDAAWDPDTNILTSYVRGDLSLEANFGNATISGRVDNIAIPSWATDSGEAEPVGAISISAAAIDDAQFVADWTGENADTTAAPDRTLSGFTGTLVGEFYGPAAEEAGGVLNGSRAATGTIPERFIFGGFGASQPDAGQ